MAIKQFLKKYRAQIEKRLFNSAATLVLNLSKVKDVLGLPLSLKMLNFSRQQYWKLRQQSRCSVSLLNRCLIIHPTQLLQKEIKSIKSYCEDERYLHWPLSSIYYQMIRDGEMHFHQNTFYKYVRLLNLKRKRAIHRRKNHEKGIRADSVFQLLHADVTIFKTLDQTRASIYIVQDNFSRAILSYSIALECKAKHMMELIQNVHSRYLTPASISHCKLLTDDGGENYGAVKDFIGSTENPVIQHIIAQKDIPYSNAMIEAANKNLKYRFLYHKTIPDYKSLCEYLQQAVDDYNNRPHAVLFGLTPTEVLNGKTIDTASKVLAMQSAFQTRMSNNQKHKCCGYSF